MNIEPRDPCPVCGGAMVGSQYDDLALGCETCAYTIAADRHRRLCAEVTLAKWIMKHAEVMQLNNWPLVQELRELIARVREASK